MPYKFILKGAGDFFSSLLVFKQMFKILSASCLFNFFFCICMERKVAWVGMNTNLILRNLRKFSYRYLAYLILCVLA